MAGEAGGTMDWCKISMLLGSCINLLALRRSLTATYFWTVNLEICINKSKDHFKRFYLRNYMKEVIRIKICLAKIFIEFFLIIANIVNKLMLEGRVTKKYSVLKLYRFMFLDMEKYLKYFKWRYDPSVGK